ncbi:hypothetical protein OGAPHI_007170 [Ogataea philodendri]|uniref:Uncharacterized protein n=1 Tax=Ogataea philodendri TaxID=1378263 RepID=A0A9P8NUV3_9ASCO|nr:uncharacterized protein OGAPHI_007170 [Ogataea philodendri]KAH3659965.1 hypothetical protein OGAPHI_007170 [Ogataea philodendri]
MYRWSKDDLPQPDAPIRTILLRYSYCSRIRGMVDLESSEERLVFLNMEIYKSKISTAVLMYFISVLLALFLKNRRIVGLGVSSRWVLVASPLGLWHPSHDGGCGSLGWEKLVELASVEVSFLGGWNVGTPLWLWISELLVRDALLGKLLQSVNPGVSHTVGELFLLSPQDVVWQVWLGRWIVAGVKGLSQDVLLDLTGLLVDHLVFRIDVQAQAQELLVKERHTGLQSPSHGRLVGSKTVGIVQVSDTLDTLGVELLWSRCCSKIQVSSKDFVGTFTRKNHLHTLSLDLSGQQVHWSRGTDGRHIVGLQVVDDVGKSIKSFLNSESVLVVDGSNVFSNLLGSNQVWSSRKTNGIRVQSGPSRKSKVALLVHTGQGVRSVDSFGLRISLLGSLISFPSSNRCNQGRVQTSRKQDTVWNFGHQSLSHSKLKSLSDLGVINRSGWNRLWVPPGRREVSGGLVGLRVVDVSWREQDDLVTLVSQTFELGCKKHSTRSLGRTAHIQRRDTNRVSGSNDTVLLLVVQHVSKHTVQVFRRVQAVLLEKWNDRLAIRQSLELVVLQLVSKLNVVVDLSVNTQSVSLVRGSDWLSTGVKSNNSQSLVAQNGVVDHLVSRPVRTTVSDPLGVLEGLVLEGPYLLDVVRCKDTTHVEDKFFNGENLDPFSHRRAQPNLPRLAATRADRVASDGGNVVGGVVGRNMQLAIVAMLLVDGAQQV